MLTKEDKLVMEENKITPSEKEEEEERIPKYLSKVELNEEQKTRIIEEMWKEFEQLKRERQEEDSKWEMLQNQYDGKLRKNEDMQFNLHRHTTKVKVDFVTRAIVNAYYGNDPIYSISPRPEFDKEGGRAICDKQEDFLDYKIDTIIPFRRPLRKAIHSAVLKGTGIIKIYHEIIRKEREREEVWEGDPIIVTDEAGNQLTDPNGQLIVKNKPLEEFLAKYPEAITEHPNWVKKLSMGGKINIKVKYKETLYNDPMPKNILVENFYVRSATEGYQGLKNAYLLVERENFTWWGLKQEEKKNNFENIDELMNDREGNRIDNYETKTYDILQCTFQFKMNPDDEEEVKIKFYVAEDKKIFLGAFHLMEGVDAEYIPVYIKTEKEGFWQTGIAEDLTDDNIAEDALLNLTLEGAYSREIITPITPKGSDLDQQFLDKRWTHGLPLNSNSGAVDFLQKYMAPQNTPGLLSLMEYIQQMQDDVSGVTRAYASGRADPIDPQAPAKKTRDLMRRAGLNVEDYIIEATVSFNEIGYLLLQMYYNISKEGRKYKIRPERVVGDQLFSEISREEMITRTNVESQAYIFDFDKHSEKQDDLALLQILRAEPLIASNPEAVYFLLSSIITNWSRKWRINKEKILPTIKELQQQKLMTAVGAVDAYVGQVMEQSRVTGQPPAFDPRQLLAVIEQGVAELVTPPPESVQRERAKEAQNV